MTGLAFHLFVALVLWALHLTRAAAITLSVGLAIAIAQTISGAAW